MSPRGQRLRLLRNGLSIRGPDHFDRRSLRALYLDLRDAHLELLAKFSRVIGGAETGYLNSMTAHALGVIISARGRWEFSVSSLSPGRRYLLQGSAPFNPSTPADQ
jgi:hypothetical protein